jgi:hypothetical protein
MNGKKTPVPASAARYESYFLHRSHSLPKSPPHATHACRELVLIPGHLVFSASILFLTVFSWAFHQYTSSAVYLYTILAENVHEQSTNPLLVSHFSHKIDV